MGLFLGYSIYHVAEYLQGAIGKKIDDIKTNKEKVEVLSPESEIEELQVVR